VASGLVMAIDPGKATGIARFAYREDLPLELVDAYTVPGGLDGILERPWLIEDAIGAFAVPFEQFVLSAGNAFTPDLEAVKIEGGLQAVGVTLNRQSRSDKALVGDSMLKRHGLWRTGKQVGWKDGRDANDAIIHGLAWAMKRRHRPTIERYWKKED
jgi:hypothetical protein